MTENEIRDEIYRLFIMPMNNPNLTEEETDIMDEEAVELVEKIGWPTVFKYTNECLRKYCKTPEQVMQFAVLYWQHDFYKYKVDDPYDFLAYFYMVINFEGYNYDGFDALDSIATTILPMAGYKYADLYHNPWYTCETDEEMYARVDKLKKELNFK